MQNSTSNDFSFYDLFTPFTTKKALILIAIISLIVYFNMLFNGFVWDDLTYIFIFPDIHVFNLIHLFQASDFNTSGYYRPIPAVYFSLLYNLFGHQAFFYHFVQLILHIIDGYLLFFFFKKYFKTVTSFFLVVIFEIHPIQVESVVYVGASQSELLFLFGMSAFLLVTKKDLSFKQTIAAMVLLLLSLLTKETAFLFAIMLIIYLWLFNKNRMIKLIPQIGICLTIYFFIRLFLAKVPFLKNTSTPIGMASLPTRILNIPNIFFYYIKTFIYPAVLGIDQRWISTSIDITHFYLPLFADIIFFLLIFYLGYCVYKKNKDKFRLYVFFFLWFFLGMGMLMQLFPLDMTVSERWFYFPIVGLLGMIGVGTTLFSPRSNKLKLIGYYLLISALLLLCIRTIIRNTNWIDPLTLYSHDILIDNNEDIESNLGVQLLTVHDFKRALPLYEKLILISPHKIDYLYDLGLIYENSGSYEKAEDYYNEVIEEKNPPLNKQFIIKNAYLRIALVFLLQNRPLKAIMYYQLAIKRYPQEVIYLVNLSYVEYSIGQHRIALGDALKAKKLLPNNVTDKLYELILNNTLPDQ